jgi:hypothetical protein
MPKNKKKGKQEGAKAAQTDDAFDDMLAEVCTADVAATTATSVSNTTSGSSSSSTPSAAPTTGMRVSDEAIICACARGDTVQLRRQGIFVTPNYCAASHLKNVLPKCCGLWSRTSGPMSI